MSPGYESWRALEVAVVLGVRGLAGLIPGDQDPDEHYDGECDECDQHGDATFWSPYRLIRLRREYRLLGIGVT
jgi:hypothetical protein